MQRLRSVCSVVLLAVCLASSQDNSDSKVKRGLTDFGYSGGHSGDLDTAVGSGSDNQYGGGLSSGYGGQVDSTQHHVPAVTITKKVPAPYPVEVEKKVPYPVHVPVDRPYQVFVPKPYPVTVPKPVPYTVKVPVPKPYTVHKPVPVPVKVPVDRPYTCLLYTSRCV